MKIDFTQARKGTKCFGGKIIYCPKCGKKGLEQAAIRGRIHVCHEGESMLGGTGLSYRVFCTFSEKEHP